MANDIVIIDGPLPKCDFCGDTATVDGKTRMGPWANMCDDDFNSYGVGIGLGKGQHLVTADDPIVPAQIESAQTPSEVERVRNLLLEAGIDCTIEDLTDDDEIAVIMDYLK